MGKTHMLNIIMFKQIGEISEKKVQHMINNGFGLDGVNGGNAHFLDSSGNLLVLSQNQITYVPKLENEENINGELLNPSRIVDTFSKVMDILLLDGESKVQVAFERSYQSTYGNAFKTSLEFLKIEGDIADIEGVRAIGLRIPFERENIAGEVKIEPFFANSNRYFLGCRIQSQKSYHINDVHEILITIGQVIISEFEPLTKKLFN